MMVASRVAVGVWLGVTDGVADITGVWLGVSEGATVGVTWGTSRLQAVTVTSTSRIGSSRRTNTILLLSYSIELSAGDTRL